MTLCASKMSVLLLQSDVEASQKDKYLCLREDNRESGLPVRRSEKRKYPSSIYGENGVQCCQSSVRMREQFNLRMDSVTHFSSGLMATLSSNRCDVS